MPCSAISILLGCTPGESGYGEFRRVEGFSIFVDMERAMAWQPSDNVEDVSFSGASLGRRLKKISCG